jgi:crotonobetainyl-CoA:carnitine CoA-transferase CaiB-like acyl-CoA transferase
MVSLGGIRVVEISSSVAGPFAGQILGDLGADVIKIERPGTGDASRTWGPPFLRKMSPTFISMNRNKRSLSVDLESPEGKDLCLQLVRQVDVVVQNLRPGALAALGLAYEAVRGVNPAIIYCDITGFGPTGPLADFPAYDPLIQAFSGLMSINGEEGRPPARIPLSILDLGTGMWSALAVVDALRRRDLTGRGALIQTSLLNTAIGLLPNQLVAYLMTGERPLRAGSGRPGIAPYQAFATTDGHVMICAGNERLWKRLCAGIGRPELAVDPRFFDNPSRVRNRTYLDATLNAIFAGRSNREWIDLLQPTGVPISTINGISDMLADPQARAIAAVVEADRSRNVLPAVKLPVIVDNEYPAIRLSAPRRGEHTEEILAELGYSPSQIEIFAGQAIVETEHSDRRDGERA